MEIVSANTPWVNYFPYCQAKTVTMLARHIVKLFTEHNFTHGMHCLLINESQLNKRWANIERCFIIKTNFVEHWWAAFNCGTIALMVPMMFLDRRGPPFIIGGIVIYIQNENIIILGFKRGYIHFENDDISCCLSRSNTSQCLIKYTFNLDFLDKGILFNLIPICDSQKSLFYHCQGIFVPLAMLQILWNSEYKYRFFCYQWITIFLLWKFKGPTI